LTTLEVLIQTPEAAFTTSQTPLGSAFATVNLKAEEK